MYQKRVVKKKVLKKKAASVAPRRPGAAAPVKPAAAEPVFFGAKPKPRKGAPSGYRPPAAEVEGFGFGAVILLLLAIALLGGVAVCFLPPDMSGIAGYPHNRAAPTANLLRKLDDAITAAYTETKETTLTFHEEELSAYVNERLKANQRGPLASVVQIHGVYCDLQPDTANLYVVRTILGRPLVIQTSWAFVGDPSNQQFKCQSSGIGLVKVPGSTLQPITAPFLRLKVACARELGALQDSSVERIRIDDGKLIVHIQP